MVRHNGLSGIRTILCSESTPSSEPPLTGTPINGSAVITATIPGRRNAPPAPATIPWSHGAGADNAYSAGQLGQVVRGAEKVEHRGGGHFECGQAYGEGDDGAGFDGVITLEAEGRYRSCGLGTVSVLS